MKTHLPILLLLLLVFAGNYAGLAQSDSLTYDLPFEEVKKLRSELVEAIENDNLLIAGLIKDSLWNPQFPTPRFLSIREYWLTLFLLGEYYKIIESEKQAEWFFYETDYPSIRKKLEKEVKQNEQLILQDIETKFENLNQNKLKYRYYELMEPSNELTEYLRWKTRVAIQEANDDFKFTEFNYHPENYQIENRSERDKYFKEKFKIKSKDTREGGLWLGLGLYFESGKYFGELSDYLSHYNAASILNIHGTYKRLYFSGTIYAVGGTKVHDYLFTDKIHSHATHFSLNHNFDVSLGYELYKNKWVYFTPYLMYKWQRNKIEKYVVSHQSQTLAYYYHIGPGLGANVDFIYLRDDYAEYAIRFSYEVSFSRNNYNINNIAGTVQQLTIGLVVTWEID